MHKIIKQPACETIRKHQPRARDSFLICDVADMPELIRKHVHSSARERAVETLQGRNEHLTALAEKYVHQFEEDIFVGRGWNVRDAVSGGRCNIPAAIAGIPYNMRQRYRTSRNISPLTLYVELTGSSAVAGDSFVKRGAAILALCRMLANTRPVELYTTTTYGTRELMQMIACKLETSPLDVTRGAAMLCDELIRSVDHVINTGELGRYGNDGGSMGWAYGEPHLERRYAGEILAGILNPGSTMFYIPAAHSNDILSDPAAWIRAMLAKYGAGADDIDTSELEQQ